MKKPYIFPLLLGSLVLTGCANGQIDAMQMRLNQQEQQIRLLNSQLSGVQPAQADTWAQVQSLRQEMSAVKGQDRRLQQCDGRRWRPSRSRPAREQP